MKSYEKVIILIIAILISTPAITAQIWQPEPPITSIFFDKETGVITLVAVDYPPDKASGVNATYYIIDDGEQQIYEDPFKLPEGTHTINYWSVDNNGNVEIRRTSIFTCDTIPPTIEITSPKKGELYVYGNLVGKRIFSDEITCIGKVPVEVITDDGVGFGVDKVFFTYDDDNSYDDNSSDGWTDTYNKMHFGTLTISVTAVDGKQLVSEPDEIEVIVYCLGFL